AGASGAAQDYNRDLIVDIDLSGVAPGTLATLYFDLLGFGLDNSSVTVDDIILLETGSGHQTPIVDPVPNSTAREGDLWARTFSFVDNDPGDAWTIHVNFGDGTSEDLQISE